MFKARIIALGSYLPKKVLTNQDLEKMVDTSDEWIFSRVGIRERRMAGPDEHSSNMGSAAAKIALEKGKWEPEEIELILTATMSPDYPNGTPSTSVLIQQQLGARRAAAVDLQAACSGFVYALATAKAYIESGLYRRILVVGTEKMSSIVDYEDRGTCVLFGDGAAAALVSSAGEGLEIESAILGADGSCSEILCIPGGGTRQPAGSRTIAEKQHYLKMNGREVFKHAVRRMGEAAEECLKKTGCSQADIHWLVPHQANVRIINALAKQMGLPLERVCQTIEKYGNTSASSVGIALDELIQSHPASENQRILLAAAGAGFTWGVILLKKILNK